MNKIISRSAFIFLSFLVSIIESGRLAQMTKIIALAFLLAFFFTSLFGWVYIVGSLVEPGDL